MRTARCYFAYGSIDFHRSNSSAHGEFARWTVYEAALDSDFLEESEDLESDFESDFVSGFESDFVLDSGLVPDLGPAGERL